VTLPLVLLPILLVRLLTVAGGVDGLSAWLAQETPPAVKLRDWRLWQEAGMQVVLNLGVVFGGVSLVGSHSPRPGSSYGSRAVAVAVCLVHLAYCTVATCVTAAAAGHLGNVTGTTVDQLVRRAQGGDEAASFVIYSEALGHLPLANLWSVVFFLSLLLSSVATLLTLVGVAVSGLSRLVSSSVPVAVSSAGVSMLCFLSSLPCSSRVGADVVRLVEEFGTRLPALVLGLLQTATLTWGYGINRFGKRMSEMTSTPPLLLRIVWSLLPVVFLLLVVSLAMAWASPSQGAAPYPGWSQGVGVFLALVSLGQVLLVGVVVVIYNLYRGRGISWLLGGGTRNKDEFRKRLCSNSYRSFDAFELQGVAAKYDHRPRHRRPPVEERLDR